MPLSLPSTGAEGDDAQSHEQQLLRGGSREEEETIKEHPSQSDRLVDENDLTRDQDQDQDISSSSSSSSSTPDPPPADIKSS